LIFPELIMSSLSTSDKKQQFQHHAHISKFDHGPQLNAVVWLLSCLSGLFLLTRLYLKRVQHHALWWDDWALLSSWLALLIQAVLVSYIVHLGYGRHPTLIPVENASLFQLPVKILSSLLIVANLWGKVSFAMTLMRIPAAWMRIAIWIILVSLVVLLGASGLLVWVQCFAWEDATKTGRACVPVAVAVPYNMFSCGRRATTDCIEDDRRRLTIVRVQHFRPQWTLH